MFAGPTIALALLAQAATPASQTAQPVYGPVAATPPKPPSTPKPERQCVNQNKDPNGNEIVVCAVKPDGYRLPPDIVEARRLKRQGISGRPRNPHETFADRSCARVGPAPCTMGPAIDMFALAAVAGEISQRLAKGQEIGSIFQTEKAKGDYQYFLEAKKEREAKEAEAQAKAAKAKALAAAAAAAKTAPQIAPLTQGSR
jgi:hypothetical protein